LLCQADGNDDPAAIIFSDKRRKTMERRRNSEKKMKPEIRRNAAIVPRRETIDLPEN
jgi:hypothetical protein